MWVVYGVEPVTGKPWRVPDTDGLTALPRDGMMCVYQPGRRTLRNGTWYMHRADKDVWVEAEDDGSALKKHILFPDIDCTRRGYYGLDEEYKAVVALVDADMRADDG
jgi:hypothetical protein